MADSRFRLDDIQDNSSMRRGLPSAHVIFGVNQTINTANLVLFKALGAAESLSPLAVRIIVERIIDGHIGQGLDLYWTRSTEIPSEEEYFTMVDGSEFLVFCSSISQVLLRHLYRDREPLHSPCRIDAC